MTAGVVVFLAVVGVVMVAGGPPRDRRQVTYQGDGNHLNAEEDYDILSVMPSTKKPLPAQVMYPGDLSNFFHQNPYLISKQGDANYTDSGRIIRFKRGGYVRDSSEEQDKVRVTDFKSGSLASESKLHASYHKPAVSVLNDVPVEMSFDGAGFLRHEEDDFEEEKDHKHTAPRRLGPRKQSDNNNKALVAFRAAFNISKDRTTDPVKFDEEDYNPNESPMAHQGPEFRPQGQENGSPFSVDFMKAYQNAVFSNSNIQPGFQVPQQNPLPTSYNPFVFNYPNLFEAHVPSGNQMVDAAPHQDPFMQNHRIQQNKATTNPTADLSSLTQQAFGTSAAYPPNLNQQQKSTRHKRSVKSTSVQDSSSESTEEKHRYTRREDQQDSSSAFIPINFDGGTIHLNLPFFGQGHAVQQNYHPRSPRQQGYSMPFSGEGRQFNDGSSERFYHPSEARRYSYGILGSGNFEVIHGGIFPGERQQSLRGGYHEGARHPYRGNDYGNYGTTEVILDGPIQGFQGFDNFPIQLLNALSKHSEVTLRRESEESSH